MDVIPGNARNDLGQRPVPETATNLVMGGDAMSPTSGGHPLPRDTQALEPCPFCGSARASVRKEPRFGSDTTENEPEGWAFFMTCSSCGARGPWQKGPGFPDEDPEQAMGPGGARFLWNRRFGVSSGTLALTATIARHDALHPDGYPPTRDGVFLGITTAVHELDREAIDAWRRGRCKCPTPRCDHHDWSEVAAELLDAAAVIMRTLRSIAQRAEAANASEQREGNPIPPHDCNAAGAPAQQRQG
jgi:hypothetical protein